MSSKNLLKTIVQCANNLVSMNKEIIGSSLSNKKPKTYPSHQTKSYQLKKQIKKYKTPSKTNKTYHHKSLLNMKQLKSLLSMKQLQIHSLI